MLIPTKQRKSYGHSNFRRFVRFNMVAAMLEGNHFSVENVKNSLANNTDQNALKFDREENLTS